MYSKEIETLLRKKEIRVGDIVRIKKEGVVYEGILMPRIELGDTSCAVVKLNNGYNVGVRIDKGTNIEKVGKGYSFLEKSKEKVSKMIFDKSLPSISILGTGGTIASRIDYRTGGVYASFSAKDIARQIPELKEIANIKAEEIMRVMSEDISPETWKTIAKKVVEDINEGYRGVIVTHGTDTMHFTAAALSFMTKDLPCPVALVGAQRSSDRGSSDTVSNVACAANFVANSDVAEVCTVMHDSIKDDFCLAIRGTKSRKMHTSRRDAFKPINDVPLAKIEWKSRKIEILNKNYRKRSNSKPYVDDKLETRVALIKVYPGLDPQIFDFYIKKGYKGFVIEATGLGHTPTLGKLSLIEKIENAINSGIPVVITSQCLYGRTHPTIYHNLRELTKRCVIFGEDMMPEVAYIKLMYVLGKTKSMEKVREMMITNIAGEISRRIL